jgi:hypothetical protein
LAVNARCVRRGAFCPRWVESRHLHCGASNVHT